MINNLWTHFFFYMWPDEEVALFIPDLNYEKWPHNAIEQQEIASPKYKKPKKQSKRKQASDISRVGFVYDNQQARLTTERRTVSGDFHVTRTSDSWRIWETGWIQGNEKERTEKRIPRKRAVYFFPISESRRRNA